MTDEIALLVGAPTREIEAMAIVAGDVHAARRRRAARGRPGSRRSTKSAGSPATPWLSSTPRQRPGRSRLRSHDRRRAPRSRRDRRLLPAQRRAHVYELGDLDDFDWPHTRWFGWEHDGRLEQVALLYTRAGRPRADRDRRGAGGSMAPLLEELLPRAARRPLRARDAAAARRASPSGTRSRRAEPHLKLALARTDLLAARAAPVDLLGEDDLLELDAFYRARVPGHVVHAADARDGPLRRDPAGRPPRLRRRRARLLADLGRGGARQRGDAAGAPWPRPGARLPAPPSAGCCSRTGSRRSRSTSGPTTPRRSPRTRARVRGRRRRTWRRACAAPGRRRERPLGRVSDARSGAHVGALRRRRARRPGGRAPRGSRSR